MINLSPSTEPLAIWSAFRVINDKNLSITQNVVIFEGVTALFALVNRIDRLYELLSRGPAITDTYLHPEIPQVLTEICAHQGVASNTLFNNSERTDRESKRSHELRLERFAYVAAVCDAAAATRRILSNKRLRNQMLHSDVHVEKAMRTPNTGWFIDTALAFRDQFTPPGIKVGFYRTFIASEEKLLHLANEISIKNLRAETLGVLAALNGTEPSPPLEPPVHSRRLPLPQKTKA